MAIRIHRPWVYVCLTTMAGLVGGAVSGGFWSIDANATARRAKTVEAEKFVLVDSHERQRAVLHVLSNGLVDFSLQGANGGNPAYGRNRSAGHSCPAELTTVPETALSATARQQQRPA